MKSFFLVYLAVLLASCTVKKDVHRLVNESEVERIIRTLSADEMQGRGLFTPGIEKAARFIESEFKEIGLQPLEGENNFRQDFSMFNIRPRVVKVTVNGDVVDAEQVIVISDQPALSWTHTTGPEIKYIKAGESFTSSYGSIMKAAKPAMVFVDEEFRSQFKQMHSYFMAERAVKEVVERPEVVFVLGVESPLTYQVNFENQINKSPLFNVVGILPGKTKPNEYVIFSGHYDHLGIIEENEGDSIANGADDDASGVTAVIALARYFKKVRNNARTLIFVAFTGEESGLLGSEYFSGQLNPAEVTAMFNIEMIGKKSKFGENAAFITGFERSDFGDILQKNLAGTDFTFHPDPYPQQNLFYRSDNATLAALGVPAHTISTVQIDKDKFYHTVDDELETLDIGNITATIQAIALSSRTIVAGTETPKRIPPLGQETP